MSLHTSIRDRRVNEGGGGMKIKKMKRCSACKKQKSEGNFYRDKRTRDGLYSSCKDCHTLGTNSSTKKWNAKNPQKQKEYREKIKSSGRKKIYNKVFRAVGNGTLKRKPCHFCGEKKVEAHHKNYSDAFNIIWLCRKCHRSIHC